MHETTPVRLSFRLLTDEQFARQAARPHDIDACVTQAFAHRTAQHKELLIHAEVHSNGLSFSANQHFDSGDKLCMLLDFPGQAQPIPLIGEVLFSVEDPERLGNRWTGVEFALISPRGEERLLQLLTGLSLSA